MIADKLGKYAHEVAEELTSDDLSEYLAFYKIKASDERKAAESSRRKRSK